MVTELRERDLRNVQFFGAFGQQRLRATSVLVVGGGGLGSPLVQHLALLGVGRISAADDEELTDTNRNRFVGAMHEDPVPGSPKVNLLQRLVCGIDPAIDFTPLHKPLISEEVFQAAREADWIFGCFDDDGPRLVLNELSIAYDKKYFDLASDIIDRDNYGGRVILSSAETGCLGCRQALDGTDTRRFFATDEQIEAEARIYGIDVALLQNHGPSVSPLNGVVASLAAMEFMVAVTGLRQPVPYLEYRAHTGKVVANRDELAPDCPICATRNLGATAEVERYLHMHYLRERRTRQVSADCQPPSAETTA